MADTNNKNLPPHSPEIADLLGFGASKNTPPKVNEPAKIEELKPVEQPLPKAPENKQKTAEIITPKTTRVDEKVETASLASLIDRGGLEDPIVTQKESMFSGLFKGIVPLFLLLIVVFVLYMGYQTVKSKYSFSNLFNLGLSSLSNKSQTSTPQTPESTTNQAEKARDAAMQAKINKEKDAYATWFRQFFYTASLDSVASYTADVSGNGLTNFQKYLLNLNPKVYGTLDPRVPDGQLVLQGIDPVTGQEFDADKKKLVDDYFNLEEINNRLAAGTVSGAQQMSAEEILRNLAFKEDSGQTPSTATQQPGQTPADSGQTQVNQQTSTSQPSYPTTSNTTPSQTPTTEKPNPQVFVAPRTGVETPKPKVYYNPQTKKVETYTPVSTTTSTANPVASRLAIDTSKTAHLKIPSLGVEVPLLFPKDTDEVTKFLRKGVVRYPGTALPGEMGTSYISGHSSGYVWDASLFKTVFEKLNNLKEGDSFTLTVVYTDGTSKDLQYVVTKKQIFKPNDQVQFANTADSLVALSTCWPIGSTEERLVVYGKLQ